MSPKKQNDGDKPIEDRVMEAAQDAETREELATELETVSAEVGDQVKAEEAEAEGAATEEQEAKPKTREERVAEHALTIFGRNYSDGRVTTDQVEAVLDWKATLDDPEKIFESEGALLEAFAAKEKQRTELPKKDREVLTKAGREIGRSHLWGRKIVSILLADQSIPEGEEQEQEAEPVTG